MQKGAVVMPIIKTHDITLYGGTDKPLVLRPLCDSDLPLLYQWNADPQVLYWTEGGEAGRDISYGPELVRAIYGGVSQHAFCFLVEYDGRPVGECWLQKMNLPAVLQMYPETMDVRRIDMALGEKDCWGRGIGTAFVGMLVDFAFCGEHVDVLHCFCEDYNIRSCRLWEKHGFTRILEEPLPASRKGKIQYHYRLTRQEYIENRRANIPAGKRFQAELAALQPSQLYISEGKLRLVREWFDPDSRGNFDPIPIKQYGNMLLVTDGHTRAVAACLAGWETIPAYWDEDELDMDAYAVDVRWCREEGISSPFALVDRIVPHKDYERLWRKRCMEL